METSFPAIRTVPRGGKAPWVVFSKHFAPRPLGDRAREENTLEFSYGYA